MTEPITLKKVTTLTETLTRKKAVSLEEATTPEEQRNALFMLVHEIRNPINNINLAGEAIKETVSDDMRCASVKSFVEIIINNANKIDLLLKNLLAQHARKEPEPLSIEQAIQTALDDASDRLFLRWVNVSLNLQHCPTIMGNPEQLSMAFLNIIINAIEAMEKTLKPVLQIKTYHSKDGITVVFKDNGAGLEQKVADKIFKMHYTSKGAGRGMGLAYARTILEQHNASISVDSIRGVGTSIVLTFKNCSGLNAYISG